MIHPFRQSLSLALNIGLSQVTIFLIYFLLNGFDEGAMYFPSPLEFF
jgi:hypothetical protein